MSESDTGLDPIVVTSLDEPRGHTAPASPRTIPVLGYSEPLHQVFVKPVLDDVLRDEAEFSNADYAPYADDLAIQPQMFGKYTNPTDLWDWRQMAALLLGDIAGKDLLD